MRNAMQSCLLGGLAVTLLGATAARADVLLYSFETGDTPNAVDGFTRNGGASSNTITQSTIGVTNGVNSGLFTVTAPGFAGAITTKVDPVFSSTTAAPTAVKLDLTVPADFTYAGGYALIGVTVFGVIQDPVDGPVGVQFQVNGASEQFIPFDMPGITKTLTIPLVGADPLTGTIEPYQALVNQGFTPTSLQFFFDKNAAITVAIDNVVAVTPPVPEPAALGAVALGTTALLRRRRRA